MDLNEISFFQLNWSIFEIVGSDFRTLGIKKNGHSLPLLLSNLSYSFHFHAMIRVGIMGKVMSGNIHARLDELPDGFLTF